MTHSASQRLLGFGPFAVDPQAGELYRDGRRLPIQHQPFEFLRCLLEQPGQVLSRDEIYRRLWPEGTFVDFEHGLNTVVRKLRRTLGDSPDSPRYVETLAGRGYRFVAEVRVVESRSSHADVRLLYREAVRARPPFVGRMGEMARLERRRAMAAMGHGGAVFVAGEPGIGKTRLLEEFAEHARRAGSLVLAGGCAPGEWAPAFGAVADAIGSFARRSDATALREIADTPVWAVVSKLAPAVCRRLPDLPAPPSLRPDEERARLRDALAQVVIGAAKRNCVVLLLDDLQWADAATLALLATLARSAGGEALLLVGAFRDVEVDRGHPLAHVIADLTHLARFEEVALGGLDGASVREWLDLVSPDLAVAALVEASMRATNGNPFFLRQLVLEWERDPPRDHDPLAKIPPSIRAMVERRLTWLSSPAARLLASASAFPGRFFFDAAARAASLEEDEALDALDEAHRARLVRSAGGPDDYEFVHAILRQTIYESLVPARRVRIHRHLAEEMEREAAEGGPAHPAEIAEQYHLSRELPGAEAGVRHADESAAQARGVGDFESEARLLRMALELAVDTDPVRPRLLGRLALALAWSGAADDAVQIASEAGEGIAASEGSDAAADFLAEAADAVWLRDSNPRVWALAAQGLRHIGERRDYTWMRLATHHLVETESSDPDAPGIPRDTPLRRAAFAGFLANRHRISPFEQNDVWRTVIFDSREQVLEQAGDVPSLLVFCAGEFRKGLAGYRRLGIDSLTRGEFASATTFHMQMSGAEVALGQLDAGEESLERARGFLGRVETGAYAHLVIGVARGCLVRARGVGIEDAAAYLDTTLRDPVLFLALTQVAPAVAVAASLHALAGHADAVEATFDVAMRGVTQLPGWAPNYTLLVGSAVASLWSLGIADPRIVELEQHLREKTLGPDFRYPNVDARLALAQLCSLGHRWDEAVHWFARARGVLDEQGARPLRAITDYDEALMYVRRGARGDRARARRLRDAAVKQFESIGMPGWIERAARLV